MAPELNKCGHCSLVSWLQLATTVHSQQLVVITACGCSPLDKSSGNCSDNTKHQHCKHQQLVAGCLPPVSCGFCWLKDSMSEARNARNNIYTHVNIPSLIPYVGLCNYFLLWLVKFDCTLINQETLHGVFAWEDARSSLVSQKI